jgi:probable HAF family extracellular repeat protein
LAWFLRQQAGGRTRVAESKEKIVKKNLTLYMVALTLNAALAVPVQLAAQDQQNPNAKHHHYQIVEIGTFGGPQSFLLQGGLSSYSFLNQHGSLSGDADTAAPEPFPAYAFTGDGYVAHTFQWQNGELTDMGALPGGGSSASIWESANGLLAGSSETGQTDPLFAGLPQSHAVLWKHGSIIDLGTLPAGGYESEAESVNSHGQVVGSALNTIPDANSMTAANFWYFNVPYGYQQRAFIWDKDSGMEDLGTLGTGTDAWATFINEKGQVAGWSYTTSSTPGACADEGVLLTTDAFIWDKEHGMVDLGNFGGTCTLVAGLSKGGSVIGISLVTGDAYQRAYLWRNGTMSDLGGSPGNNTGAQAQNEGGQIVGFEYLDEVTFHATLWRSIGKITDLGTLGKDVCSYSIGINDATQVVGQSSSNCDDFDNARAFLWEKGSMVNLNNLVPRGSTLRIQIPYTINNQGEIGANGVDVNGDSHAALLIPCDENHPNIAGCDYSLVEAAVTRESPTPAIEKQPSPNQSNSVRQLLRRRLGPLSHIPRPMTAAASDAKAPISQKSDWPLEDEIVFSDGAELNTSSGSGPDSSASQNSCPAAHCPHPTHSESCGACSCPFPHHGIGFLGYDSVHHRSCTVCVCT